MSTVLVIDDDRTIQHLVTSALGDLGLTVKCAFDAGTGVALTRELRPDLVLLDVKLPDLSGLECFERLHQIDNKLPVVFITASGSSETAIDAMQLGAYDYLMKPLDLPELKALVQQALETRRMMSVKVAIPADTSSIEPGGEPLVGRSSEMMKVYAQIGRVADQDVTVLIRGESGTGKELVARAIYHHSPRKDSPFLAVNCAALTDTLLESELFGHEKGAFTGADSRRIGKFEQCSGGTIFLDEIGDMSPLLQSKVLRLLQEQRFERVGGNETIETDVRIITATHRDLDTMVHKGKFRGDLFYRINGFTIELPPLRERGNDLKVLIQHFLSRFIRELKKDEIEGFHASAVERLVAYDWPGNIRELQSVIRQCILTTTGPVVVPEFLPDEILEYDPNAKQSDTEESPSAPAVTTPDLAAASNPEQNPTSVLQPDQPVGAPVGSNGSVPHDSIPIEQNGHVEPDSVMEATPSVEEPSSENDLIAFIDRELSNNADDLYARSLELMERYLITRVLGQTGGNQSQAAKILGITRGSLRTKIRSLNIVIEQVVSLDR